MARVPIHVVHLDTDRALPEHHDRNIVAVPAEHRLPHPVVFSIDPGETTGWSLIQVHNKVISERAPLHENILTFHHGQVDCGKGIGQLEDDHHTGDASRKYINPGYNPSGEAVGVRRLMQLIDEFPGAAVLIEDFILDFKKADKTRASLSPVRVTARLEQELWHRSRQAFRQTPSLAKSTMTDDRLKEFNFYVRTGGEVHARDADRHGLTFIRRAQTDPTLAFVAWPYIFDPPVPKKKKAKKKQQSVGERITFPVD